MNLQLQPELRCPKCQGVLADFFQRNQNLWCVLHARRTDCRIEEFGRSEPKDKGGTPQQALGRARSAIAQFNQNKS